MTQINSWYILRLRIQSYKLCVHSECSQLILIHTNVVLEKLFDVSGLLLNCHTRWIATNKLMAFISRVRKNRFLLFNYFSFCTRNKELHVPKSSPDTSKSFSNTTFVWIRINWEHSECTQSLYDWIRSLNIYQEFICVIVIPYF
jgi:hypothetical protein